MGNMITIIFYIILYISNGNAEAFLRRTHILLLEGDTLLNYYIFNTTAIPSKCEVTYLENKLPVIMPLPLISPTTRNSTKGTGDVSTRIQPLFRNICGFTFSNYSSIDPTNFTLTMNYRENGNISVNNNTFEIAIKNVTLFQNRTIIVKLGAKFVTLSCGNLAYGIYCALYHPSGLLVAIGSSKCEFNFKTPIIIEDIGEWKCVISVRLSMRETSFYIILKLPAPAIMNTWYTTSSGYGSIGCQYIPEQSSQIESRSVVTDWCQLIRPDKTILTISEVAGVTDRYTTIGTKFENHTCQIEFLLPIQPFEIGPWKCIIGEALSYVMVNYEPKVKSQPTKSKHIVQLNTKAQIFCEVDYSSEDCYITSPQGTIYSGGTRANEFNSGKCLHVIEKVKETDLGEWQCHFAHPVASHYEIISVVLVLVDHVDVLTANVELMSGDEMTLLCHAQTAILNCAFVDPHGKTYHAIPKRKTEGYEYTGRGLLHGDCGIAMSKAKVEDSGEWQCLVRLFTEDVTLNSKMLSHKLDVLVNSYGLNGASTVGVSVGVAIAIVAMFATAGYRKYHVKKRQTVKCKIIPATEKCPRRNLTNIIDTDDKIMENLV